MINFGVLIAGVIIGLVLGAVIVEAVRFNQVKRIVKAADDLISTQQVYLSYLSWVTTNNGRKKNYATTLNYEEQITNLTQKFKKTVFE